VALQSLSKQVHDREAKNKIKSSIKSQSKSLGISQALVMAALLHIPIYLVAILGLRLAALTDPSAAVGGILWFENLSSPDPLARLVLLSFSLALLNLKLGNSFIIHPLIRAFQWFIIMSIVPLQSQLPQVFKIM
jgi:hypothetical protein